MNRSVRVKTKDKKPTPNREAQLLVNLEHEQDFKRRQELFKALWRVRQSGRGNARI